MEKTKGADAYSTEEEDDKHPSANQSLLTPQVEKTEKNEDKDKEEVKDVAIESQKKTSSKSSKAEDSTFSVLTGILEKLEGK